MSRTPHESKSPGAANKDAAPEEVAAWGFLGLATRPYCSHDMLTDRRQYLTKSKRSHPGGKRYLGKDL